MKLAARLTRSSQDYTSTDIEMLDQTGVARFSSEAEQES